MCGIVYLQGPEVHDEIAKSINLIAHRGPDDESIVLGNGYALAFRRLAINDQSLFGRQPFVCGDLKAAINGEIYNYKELAEKYSIALNGPCDSKILLPLYEKMGDGIIDVLDGFFSAVIVNDKSIVCLRDEMGQKPLFWGKTQKYYFISSELKAVRDIVWFDEVPLGISKISLCDFSIKEYRKPKKKIPSQNLYAALDKAVQKRIPVDGSDIGIFLSGGLDSSIVAALAMQYRKNVHFFSLADKDSIDYPAIMRMVDCLKIDKLHLVPLPSFSEIGALIRTIVYHTESFNPSIISNGLATFLLAKKAREYGLKVVLCGEGADELFGGYRYFNPSEDWKSFRDMLVGDMHFTELRRLDMGCMANGIEPRCPFLDRDVLSISKTLGYEDLFKNGFGKSILRETFANLLPELIINRKKISCDVGSGIRRLVVNHLRSSGISERETLKNFWQEYNFGPVNHPYFSKYPAFDELIDKRGAVHC